MPKLKAPRDTPFIAESFAAYFREYLHLYKALSNERIHQQESSSYIVLYCVSATDINATIMTILSQ